MANPNWRLANPNWRLANPNWRLALTGQMIRYGMPSSLHLDPVTITDFVNDLLGRSAHPKIRAIACVREADQVRVTLKGVETGLTVFGMALPAIDAEVLMRGTTTKDVLHLTWSVEGVVGIPAMAAKLVGKPTLAKMLRDAVGSHWGLDQALSADEGGDLLLTLSLMRIPGCAGLRINALKLPAGDVHVLTADFSWGS